MAMSFQEFHGCQMTQWSMGSIVIVVLLPSLDHLFGVLER
jgi:hypothetical protein